MAKSTNEWDVLVGQLKDDALALVDELAPHLRGGKLPPGAVPVPRSRQVYEFLLFTTPGMQLRPEQQQERRQLWQDKLSQWSPVQRKQWALSMQTEVDRMTKGAGAPEVEEVGEMAPVGPVMKGESW